MPTDDPEPRAETTPSDAEVADTAAEAAEGLIFSRYANAEVQDVDVTVRFEDGVLDLDVYIHAPEADPPTEAVADEAIAAAESAVDDLFAEE